MPPWAAEARRGALLLSCLMFLRSARFASLSNSSHPTRQSGRLTTKRGKGRRKEFAQGHRSAFRSSYSPHLHVTLRIIAFLPRGSNTYFPTTASRYTRCQALFLISAGRIWRQSTNIRLRPTFGYPVFHFSIGAIMSSATQTQVRASYQVVAHHHFERSRRLEPHE